MKTWVSVNRVNKIKDMKGYILKEKGKALWEELPAPEIGPYDALVRPTAVATCTTDVHLIETAAWPNAVGKVIGHEGVGIVEKVGELVKDFKPGDRVVIPSAGSNWRHPKAQRGEAKYHQDLNPYFSKDPGLGGNFSELVKAVDADSRLAHIPESVTDIQAVMIPDMIGTGFTGVERMQIGFGDTVLIMGIGPVGLMAVAAAALRGAGRIIAVGSRPNTVELAKQYGATDIIDYKDGDILEQVMALTANQPVDSVLIASGGDASESFTTALKAVKFGGHVACVSIFFQENVTIPLSVWEYGGMEKFLTGVLIQDGREYFERLLQLIAHKRLDPTPLVTHVLKGWDKLDEGLQLMRERNPDVIKAVIIP
ncbi:zinc-binding dehydrogenase [Sphingobacterium sp. MYb388]|uniref:zinc-binding dehydrogenase n=1 Tax=Sphingobacterium sp. MYb388 TaxID=2745437 RepID=UPI0030A974F7